jgi:hypothetical protein
MTALERLNQLHQDSVNEFNYRCDLAKLNADLIAAVEAKLGAEYSVSRDTEESVKNNYLVVFVEKRGGGASASISIRLRTLAEELGVPVPATPPPPTKVTPS